MESIRSENKSEQKTRRIRKSGQLFGVGAAMLVVTVVMTAVGGTYGAMVGAFISGTCIAFGIDQYKRGN